MGGFNIGWQTKRYIAKAILARRINAAVSVECTFDWLETDTAPCCYPRHAETGYPSFEVIVHRYSLVPKMQVQEDGRMTPFTKVPSSSSRDCLSSKGNERRAFHSSMLGSCLIVFEPLDTSGHA